MIAIAIIEIKPALHLSSMAIGMVLAATFLGMMIGGGTLGRMADMLTIYLPETARCELAH